MTHMEASTCTLQLKTRSTGGAIDKAQSWVRGDSLRRETGRGGDGWAVLRRAKDEPIIHPARVLGWYRQ